MDHQVSFVFYYNNFSFLTIYHFLSYLFLQAQEKHHYAKHLLKNYSFVNIIFILMDYVSKLIVIPYFPNGFRNQVN